MKNIRRIHCLVLSYTLIVYTAGLLCPVFAKETRCCGATQMILNKKNDDRLPIVTIAGDIQTRTSGRVIAIDPSAPNQVTQVYTAAAGPISAVAWTKDHAYLILTSVNGIFLCPYDKTRRSFGPLQAVSDPKIDKTVLWPAGYTKREGDIARALRTKVGLARHKLHKADALPLMDSLTWSSDQRQIAFTIPGEQIAGSEGEPFQDLWLAQTDGLRLKRLGRGSHPHWSPDGRFLLAIDGTEFNGRSIIRYDTLTGKRTILRSGRLECFATAVYSPTGTSIAVFGASDSGNEFDEGVFLMDNNGRGVRKLASQKSIGAITYPTELAW
jgi:WD40 repeat protein